MLSPDISLLVELDRTPSVGEDGIPSPTIGGSPRTKGFNCTRGPYPGLSESGCGIYGAIGAQHIRQAHAEPDTRFFGSYS